MFNYVVYIAMFELTNQIPKIIQHKYTQKTTAAGFPNVKTENPKSAMTCNLQAVMKWS